MQTEMIAPTMTASTSVVLEEQLHCALTGKPVSAQEAYWAPPLVTARELVSTVFNTLIHAPGTLGALLMAEQPNVPYAPDAREELASRRSSEQLKLLLGMLIIVALVVAPILVMAMR